MEEINNIIQNKQECRLWNLIYNLSAVHVKLLRFNGSTSWENTKKTMYDSMEPVAKKRFLEGIKRKYSTMDARKKK